MSRRRTNSAGKRGSSSGYIVRASELGSYEYCHRAWWLREIAGVAPSSEAQARLEQGRQRHAQHGRAVAFAPLLLRGGAMLLAVAAVLLLLLLLIGG